MRDAWRDLESFLTVICHKSQHVFQLIRQVSAKRRVGLCQVWVYSDDFQVSLDEKEEQEFGQRLACAGVTDWIQRQRDKH